MTDTLQTRVQLNNAVDAELQKRTAAHQATIARLRSAQALAPAAVQPLAMLAHGDSWFDYPLNGNSPIIDTSDIVHYLGLTGSPLPAILNVSHFGDATTDEMSWPKQQKMIDAINDKNNWLNSMGCPTPSCFREVETTSSVTNSAFTSITTLGAAVGSTRYGSMRNWTRSRRRIGICSRFATAMPRACRFSGIATILHCRTASIRSVPAHGSSLRSILPAGATPDGRTIVRDALIAFKNKLLSLQAGNNLYLIDTQGLFVDSDWANELHPFPTGFMKVAQQFAAALRAHFPGRI